MSMRAERFRGLRLAEERRIAYGHKEAAVVAERAPRWYVFFSRWQFMLVAMPMMAYQGDPVVLTAPDPDVLLASIRSTEAEREEQAEFAGVQDLVAAGGGSGPVTVYNSTTGEWDVVGVAPVPPAPSWPS